jgi:hypothetical protein
MKPQLVSEALDGLIQTQTPVFLWGSPGVGKSALTAQAARRLGRELADIRVPLLDAVDLRGLPSVQNGKCTWLQPDFLPTEGAGVLFLDELNAAPQLVQAACYQLVLDRRLADYRLPEAWSIVAAGNRETDRAVANRMPSALANRFVHLTVEPDVNDWVQWALGEGLAIEVIAFVRFRPSLLNAFDPGRNEKAFPTPRSWHVASRLLQSKPSEPIRYDLFAGTVGEGAAAEFLGFLRVYETLPNPDSILMNPASADVPTDPAVLYALTGALARKASDQTADNLMAYADRLPAEFSVLLVKDSLRHNPAFVNTRGYVAWATNHQDVLL